MRLFTAMNDTRQLRRVARDRFGWSKLRAHQLAAMRAVMSGRDTLVVAPTGGGKSGVYQVPATLLPGPTIVVSPLLALQQDQIAGLNARDHATLAAVRLSSAESPAERRAAIEALRSGEVEFVFLTPEQLADPDRLAEIRALKPSLIAIDEAHCISAWGHDFRPDYLQLGRIINDLGRPPVVALTATASPPVRDDIVARLGLRDPRVIVAGLDRPNLFLEATQCPDEEYRWRRLLARVQESPPPGIVYAPTRRTTEELAARFTAAGVPAAAYHGGMSGAERERCHEAFLADEVPVMVATTAFGMGIDKPNLRWVNHVSLPDSPDSYFQEIGRAGRDGEPAQALLLHRTEDSGMRKFFSSVTVDLDELSQLAALLRAAERPLTRAALRESTGLGPRRLGQLLTLLEEVGGAVTVRGAKVRAPRYGPEPREAAELAVRQAERRQTVQRSRLDMMRHFAETDHCRGQAILAYFGDHLDSLCGHCDNCYTGAAAQAAGGAAAAAPDPDVPATRAGTAGDATAAELFPVHSTVRHAAWGAGMVLQYAGDQMTVLFDDVGYKTLSVPVVEENGLLAAEPV
ncbi:MAG TPA: ATP-dependent DNA helicase RecQ [Micromonosporaceae bacterium]|nr:ATP-dependent DNA helicase RecQ [Micromonosporaceae bacterium]